MIEPGKKMCNVHTLLKWPMRSFFFRIVFLWRFFITDRLLWTDVVGSLVFAGKHFLCELL